MENKKKYTDIGAANNNNFWEIIYLFNREMDCWYDQLLKALNNMSHH